MGTVANIDNALLLADAASLDQAIEVLTDPGVPMPTRGLIYAGLRRIRLRIDRVLRPVTQEIEMAMVAADAKDWGPLHLSWRSIDVKYPVNDRGNWEDATVQEQLDAWAAEVGYRPFIASIPRHREIDTRALGEAMAQGDPAARDLWNLLKERRLRTDAGKTASLTVREDKP